MKKWWQIDANFKGIKFSLLIDSASAWGRGHTKLLSEQSARLILLAYVFWRSLGCIRAFKTQTRCVFGQLIKPYNRAI